MAIEKDKERGTWTVRIRYTDYMGKKRVIKRRGFKRRKDAKEVEIKLLTELGKVSNMKFDVFVDLYLKDIAPSVRESTLFNKKNIINYKIMPFFKDFSLFEIKPIDIVHWQNLMLQQRDRHGKPYSQVYLRSMQSQFNAIMNHAERFYGLKNNPVHVVKSMGKKKAKEMSFWTDEEYMKFRETQKDCPDTFYAFELLYWTGMRIGELLALEKQDIDLEKKRLSITKSYSKIEGKEIIGDPKTEKGNRVIDLPDMLCDELEELFAMHYKIDDDTRLFTMSKTFYGKRLKQGARKAGLKEIRLHDLRHSHISYLLASGFTAVEVGARVGQESIGITFDYAHMFPSKQKAMVDRIDDTMCEIASKEELALDE